MRVEHSDGQAVVFPRGRIDITSSQELKETMDRLVAQGTKKVCLDFGEVTGIDSSGLGKLLLFQKKLQQQQGQLSIRNVASEYVKKIFALVYLNKVITIEGLPS